MVALLVSVTNSQQTPTEEELKQMLETYNTEALDLCNARSIGSWNVATNVGNAAFLQPQVIIFKITHKVIKIKSIIAIHFLSIFLLFKLTINECQENPI